MKYSATKHKHKPARTNSTRSSLIGDSVPDSAKRKVEKERTNKRLIDSVWQLIELSKRIKQKWNLLGFLSKRKKSSFVYK